jgi:WS/DGAT/MGAT family acyltransferase
LSARLRPLSGLDAGFLYLEESGTPMHVGSVMLIEVPKPATKKKAAYDFRAALVSHLRDRMPRAPALRRVLHHAPLSLGHPMWMEAPAVELEKHVLRRKLPGKGGHSALMRLVGKLHAQRLDRDVPMWQFVVVENVEPGVVALYSKIHHALLDGQGGVALAQALLDIEAKPVKARKSAKGNNGAPPPVSRRDLGNVAVRSTVNQFAKLLRALPATLKLAGGLGEAANLLGTLRENVLLAPNSVFNRQLGPRRSFAAISLPLDDIKRCARGHGVSLNDVVMAICAGALRELLLKSEALPKKTLIAAMPVSLREAGNQDANNQVSMVQCALHTDIVDPLERLHAIHADTQQIKQRVAAFKNLIPTDFPGLAAPIWAAGLSRLWSLGHISERLPALANLAISNVPGPPIPLYLAGARLRHYYPVSIVTHGLGLNITVQSYAGHLEFGLTACGDIVAKPDILARAMQRSLAELLERLPA